MDATDQLHHRLVLENCKLEHSVNPLQLVTENAPKRHTARHIWRLVLWTCVLSAGAILLLIELTSGPSAPTLVAMVTLLPFAAFGDRLMQKNKVAYVPMSVVEKNDFTSLGFFKSYRVSRLRFDCFTKEEKASWLKNEPNFTKRIVTPLDLAGLRHRRFRSILNRFLTKTSVEIRDYLKAFLSDPAV